MRLGHTDLPRANFAEFCGGDSGLLCRVIAEPQVPDRRPGKADHSEHPEDRSPAPMLSERNEQNRRKRSAKPARSPDEALGTCMLLLREPLGDDARCVGVSARCAHSEQEPCARHLQKISAPASERSETGPPDRNTCQ